MAPWLLSSFWIFSQSINDEADAMSVSNPTEKWEQEKQLLKVQKDILIVENGNIDIWRKGNRSR